ncbi:MAG: toluene tolerance protein [Cycloclasticus sp.]|nr:MAG: toluene tolerance protein [Cycloclasticus sp.]
MENISHEQYLQLIDGADIIEKDGAGLKVLDTNKGEMIKLFRRKRLFSSALLNPYAVRFANNAKYLKALSVPTIVVNRLIWCNSIKRHIVIYQRLEGKLLRDVLTNTFKNSDGIFRQFGEFIATLHNKGVYFRSAHLKNILVLPNGKFALIDISDMQIKKGALNLHLRERNFQHILRYQEDKNLVRSHFQSFFSSYSETSQLNKKDASTIEHAIQSILASSQGA